MLRAAGQLRRRGEYADVPTYDYPTVPVLYRLAAWRLAHRSSLVPPPIPQNGDGVFDDSITDTQCSEQSVALGGVAAWIYNAEASTFTCTGTSCDLTDTDDFKDCCMPGGDTKTNVSFVAPTYTSSCS
jgi:hypothetical protein